VQGTPVKYARPVESSEGGPRSGPRGIARGFHGIKIQLGKLVTYVTWLNRFHIQLIKNFTPVKWLSPRLNSL
jgi:hypothetical protein